MNNTAETLKLQACHRRQVLPPIVWRNYTPPSHLGSTTVVQTPMAAYRHDKAIQRGTTGELGGQRIEGQRNRYDGKALPDSNTTRSQLSSIPFQRLIEEDRSKAQDRRRRQQDINDWGATSTLAG
jgi:hypothetical protein